jgi:hypothetical protein
MISDRELDIAATMMISHYGAEAVMEAERQATELESHGDFKGAEPWRLVIALIAAKLKEAPATLTPDL